MSRADEIAPLACPRCGGTPDPEGAAGQLARCESCGVLGRIEDARGGPALAALPEIEPDALAARIAERAAADGQPAPQVDSAELIFVPFWRAESVLVGRVRGQRAREKTVLERDIAEDGRASYVQRRVEGAPEDVSREVQRVQVALVSACPLDEMGLPTLDRRRQRVPGLAVGRKEGRGRKLILFHPDLRQRGVVLDPFVPRRRAEAEVDAVMAAARDGLTGGLLPGAEAEAVELTREMGLVYHPLYFARLSRGGARGTAAIDAVSGEVVSCDISPVSVRALERRLLSLGAAVAGLAGGALARAGLFMQAARYDIAASRLRTVVVAVAILVAAGVGLVRLARAMEEKS